MLMLAVCLWLWWLLVRGKQLIGAKKWVVLVVIIAIYSCQKLIADVALLVGLYAVSFWPK